jgi:hypothetical protein
MENSNQTDFVAKSRPGKLKLVALVRDKDGYPKFDNPHNVPQPILDMLTSDDLEYLELLKSEVN